MVPLHYFIFGLVLPQLIVLQAEMKLELVTRNRYT